MPRTCLRTARGFFTTAGVGGRGGAKGAGRCGHRCASARGGQDWREKRIWISGREIFAKVRLEETDAIQVDVGDSWFRYVVHSWIGLTSAKSARVSSAVRVQRTRQLGLG